MNTSCGEIADVTRQTNEQKNWSTISAESLSHLKKNISSGVVGLDHGEENMGNKAVMADNNNNSEQSGDISQKWDRIRKQLQIRL